VKTLKLAFTFYKGFFFTSLSITFLCLFIYRVWQVMPVILAILFWFKMATYLMTFFHIRAAKRKEFYYYQALGVSKTTLWVISFIVDFFLFSILLYITNILYHA